MKYQVRPGIVMVKVCKVCMLVPSRSASVYCKEVLPLALPYVLTWKMLEAGRPDEDILRLLGGLTREPSEAVLARLDTFRKELVSMGFLIEVDD